MVMSVTLGLGVSAVIGLTWDRAIRAWCAEAIWGTPYQEGLGFKTGWFRDSAGQPTCWGITEVTNGGLFDKAGVREGDVPWQFKNAGSPYFFTLYYKGTSGAITGFYSFLERSRGLGPVEFTVCPKCEPCGGANERRITLEVPAS